MCNCHYGAPDCEQGKRLREALALAVKNIYPMHGPSWTARNAALEAAGKAWASHVQSSKNMEGKVYGKQNTER